MRGIGDGLMHYSSYSSGLRWEFNNSHVYVCLGANLVSVF
jgi:hypothetical protein